MMSTCFIETGINVSNILFCFYSVFCAEQCLTLPLLIGTFSLILTQKPNFGNGPNR